MRTEHVDDDGRTVVREDDRDEPVLTDKDLREAYERGRRDEAHHHRRNWLLTIVTALLAIAGLIVLVLAALNGSFARGGRVIDQQLSIAADRAEPALRDAAQDIREAGTPDQPEPQPDVVQTPAGPRPAAPEAR